MADPGTPSDPLAELAFEIERFEWIGDDRLEVTGRWFGVRGLRFIRPTLHVRLGDRRRRLIALLDDKPWPADGEGPWIAAFTWSGPHDGVTAARLEVAPDVVLDLPVPGEDAAGATLNPRPRQRPAARRKPTAPRRKPEPTPPPADKAPSPPAAEPSAPAVAEPAAEPSAPAVAEPAAEPSAPAVAEPAAEPFAPAVTEPAAEPLASAAAEPSAEPLAPAVDAAPAPAVDIAPRSPATELAALALERRLVEERAARERVVEELAEARAQIAALSEHQTSAVERAEEVVRLEGELAAARARAERAEAALASRDDDGEHVARIEDELASAREDLAEAREPLEITPLPSRFDQRRRRPEWGTRVAAVVLVLILLAAFASILTLL